MVENPFSGILAVTPEDERPERHKADGELHWPNGAIGYVFTSEDDAIRGFNGDLAWLEEIGAWKYPHGHLVKPAAGAACIGAEGRPGARDYHDDATTDRADPLDHRQPAHRVITGGITYENAAAANLDEESLEGN